MTIFSVFASVSDRTARYARSKMRITPAVAFVIAALLLGLSACDEISPTLNLSTQNTGPSSNALEDQPRGVLIEEYTGVRCVNCPAGAEAIAQLKDIHGVGVIPVGLHTGFFANPYPESTIDFRTGDADAIEAFTGAPSGYPSSVIDRKQFQGETGLQLPRNSWAGYVSQQLQEEPQVAIGLELNLNDAANELTVEVELLGRAGTGGREAFLSVLLLENKIINVQLTPEGKDFEYSHEHVFREAITAPLGDQLGAIAAGANEQKSFTVPIRADYTVDNIEIVAFVHYADSDEGGKEILQAVSEKMAL